MQDVLILSTHISESFGDIGLELAGFVLRNRGSLRAALLILITGGSLATWFFRRRSPAIFSLLPLSFAIVVFAQLSIGEHPAPRWQHAALALAYLQTLIVCALFYWLLRRRRGEAALLWPSPHSVEGGSEVASPVTLRRLRPAPLILLILLAIPIRLWEFSEYPYSWSQEFTSSGLRALSSLRQGHPHLLSLFDLDSPAYLTAIWPHHLLADAWALLFLVFGSSIEVMKALPTILGLGSVLLTWLVGTRWLGIYAGAGAAFLVAVSPYMIGLSRDLWSHIVLLVPYTLLTIHLLLSSLERPRYWSVLGTGLLAGGALHLYQPAYVLPAVVAICWGAKLVGNARWRRAGWPALLASCGLILLVVAPLAYFEVSFDGRFTKHIRDKGIRAQYNESLQQRAVRNGKDLWRHLVYDGTPVRFNNGVRQQDTPEGSVHGPLTAGFFFVGLGLAVASARRLWASRTILAVLILGTLPGLGAIKVLPRRLIILEPAYYLLAGWGLAAVMACLIALFGSKLRPIALLLAGLTVFCTLSISWGSYIEMCRTTPRDTKLDLARTLAHSIDNEMIVLGHPVLCQTVEILRWNDLGTPEIRNRCRVAANEESFDKLEAIDGVQSVRFVFRADWVSLTEFEDAAEAFEPEYPTWDFATGDIADKQKYQHYFWLRAPIGDLRSAKEIARSLLFGTMEPQAVGPKESLLPPPANDDSAMRVPEPASQNNVDSATSASDGLS